LAGLLETGLFSLGGHRPGAFSFDWIYSVEQANTD